MLWLAQIDVGADDGASEGLFDWFAGQWWAPVVLCVWCCGVGLWMIRSLVLHRGRDARIERHAVASGFTYSDQDAHGLSRIRFRHFAQGDGRGWTATNVVTCRGRDGLTSHAFDVSEWTEFDVVEGDDGERLYRRRGPGSQDFGFSRVVRRHRGSTRSAAVTELPLNAPTLLVVRENLASKLFAAATRLDLDTESELFNRSYHVLCEDREFARTVLDARMVDLMVRTEGRISFELTGTWGLLATVQVEPELMPGLARLAEELRGVVPRLAVDRWPRAAGLAAG